jgi:outer membrane receptor protein involved in Fe transport
VRSWAFRESCGAVLIALLAGPCAAAAQQATISGVVFDVSGAPVPGATVTAAMPDGTTLEATTDGLGRFTFTGASARLQILTDGFERVDVAADAGRPIILVLRPATFADSVLVTATRSDERLPSASSATVLASAELANMAAGALDDALRQTPGFSLFRRSSSRVANPTAQGVTLRGLSGSGASRTLVLADGAPLNDPFGNWVYWNRIPHAAVDRVEVVRGAAGDLYGGGALGGVAQILTVQPDRTRVRAVVDGGSHETARGSFFAGGRKNGWAGAGSYEGVTTDGVYIVAAEDRGPVDTRANSRYHTGALTGGRQADTWHARAKGAWYTEDRGNGTPLQVNGTPVPRSRPGMPSRWSWAAAVTGGGRSPPTPRFPRSPWASSAPAHRWRSGEGGARCRRSCPAPAERPASTSCTAASAWATWSPTRIRCSTPKPSPASKGARSSGGPGSRSGPRRSSTTSRRPSPTPRFRPRPR